jgi:hypothetical protein
VRSNVTATGGAHVWAAACRSWGAFSSATGFTVGLAVQGQQQSSVLATCALTCGSREEEFRVEEKPMQRQRNISGNNSKKLFKKTYKPKKNR